MSTIAALCKRGWVKQMVLSHDACCHIDWFSKEMVKQLAPRWSSVTSPTTSCALRAESRTPTSAMTVDNPRGIFERQGAY